MIRPLSGALAAVLLATPLALAAPATCFTTQEGEYACDFTQFAGDGSFTITAPGKPSYTLSIAGPDKADGFADHGDGNVRLPGPFYRDFERRACWTAQETNFTICAY